MRYSRAAAGRATAFINAARSDRSQTLIALDVDGTVSGIVASPQTAFVDHEMRALLSSLAREYQLWFISGREANETARVVGVAAAGYIGHHGLEMPQTSDSQTITPEPPFGADLAKVARAVIRDVPEVAPFIERKQRGVAFHYRAIASPDVPRRLRESIEAHLVPGLSVLSGKMVLEVIGALERDKGSALRWLIASLQPGRVLAAGDDQTDVAMFRALARRRNRLRVAVRQGLETPQELVAAADVVVDGVLELRALLEQLR